MPAIYPHLPSIASLVYSLQSMETVASILPILQVVLSILLVATILLQRSGSGLGGAFGGDNFSATFHKRRGAERFFFVSSIVLGILFALSAFAALLI